MQILSGIQFANHFIELGVVETRQFVGGIVNVTLTPNMRPASSSMSARSKHQAIGTCFSVRTCYVFLVLKCRVGWTLSLWTFWALACGERCAKANSDFSCGQARFLSKIAVLCTKKFVGSNVNVILTRQRCSQRSSMCAGSQRQTPSARNFFQYKFAMRSWYQKVEETKLWSRSVYIWITCSSSSASAQCEDKQVNRYQWRKAVANMWKILCSHSNRLPMISPKRRLQKHQKNPLLTVLFQIAAGHPAPCFIFFIPIKDIVCRTCFLQFTMNVKLALDAEFLFDGNFQLTVAQYDFLEKGPDAPPGCILDGSASREACAGSGILVTSVIFRAGLSTAIPLFFSLSVDTTCCVWCTIDRLRSIFDAALGSFTTAGRTNPSSLIWSVLRIGSIVYQTTRNAVAKERSFLARFPPISDKQVNDYQGFGKH